MSIIQPGLDYLEKIQNERTRLQTRYDSTFELKSPEQMVQATKLIKQIGTIDWRGEGYNSPDQQRDLSMKFCWGHNHRFTSEMDITGRMKDRHILLATEFIHGFGLSAEYFQDRSVLDIGCWTGGTTLTLKLLGAARVHAIDEVNKYANTAHRLATEVYGYADVSAEGISLYELDNGKFDLVYVPGVVYHLSDPVLGLRRLYNRLHDGGGILVESAGIQHEESMCWFKGNGLHFGGTETNLNRGGWAWFWPSPVCLENWMLEAGFTDVSVFYSPVSQRVYARGVRDGYKEITRAGLSVRTIE